MGDKLSEIISNRPCVTLIRALNGWDPHTFFIKKCWCKVVALELKKALTFLLKQNLKPNHYPKARIRPMKNVKCEEISFWSKCIKVNETGTVWCFLVYLQSTCVD